MDWVSGREDRIANTLDRHGRLDYVVGSVHFIRDLAVDHDAYDVWAEINDPDKIWALYFETLPRRSGPGCTTSAPIRTS